MDQRSGFQLRSRTRQSLLAPTGTRIQDGWRQRRSPVDTDADISIAVVMWLVQDEMKTVQDLKWITYVHEYNTINST